MVNNANYDLFSLRCAYEVSKSKSITKTANKLALSKVAVSKRISLLEKELGIRLFLRTTRMIQTTPESHPIFEDIKHILEKVEGLNRELFIAPNKGTIRISANSSMANAFLSKVLQEYQVNNPLIKIELIVTDSVLDLIDHNIDIAVRINPDKNSFLIGKKVGDYKLHFVAAPSYIKRHSKMTNVQGMIKHPFIALDQHFNRALEKDRALFSLIGEKRLFKTNDSNLITKELIEGRGVGLRSNWDAKAFVKSKQLVILFPNYFPNAFGSVWILSHPDRIKINRVRSLLDFLNDTVPGFL